MNHLSIILSIFFLSLCNIYAQDTIRERNIEFSLFPYSYNIPVGSFAKKAPNNTIEDYAKPHAGFCLGLSYKLNQKTRIVSQLKAMFFSYDLILHSTKKQIGINNINYKSSSFTRWRSAMFLIGIQNNIYKSTNEKLNVDLFAMVGITNILSPSEVFFKNQYDRVLSSDTTPNTSLGYSLGIQASYLLNGRFKLIASLDYAGTTAFDRERKVKFYNGVIIVNEISVGKYSHSIQAFNAGLGIAYRFWL